MTRVPFRWQWHWGMAVLVALLLPLTVSLGFWQLQRADEKRGLLADHEERRALPPLMLERGWPDDDSRDEGDLRYREATFVARIDNERLFLLDNRPRRGRQGYEVHVLAQVVDSDGLPTGLGILVNRGWIGTGLDRALLPEIPPVIGPVRLEGYLYQPPSEALVFGADAWPPGEWPLVVQSVDLERVERRLGVELPPYTLRLSPVNVAALEADWPVVIDGPAKHIGYAVQWFAMAMVLLVLAVFANSNLLQVLKGRTQTVNEDEG